MNKQPGLAVLLKNYSTQEFKNLMSTKTQNNVEKLTSKTKPCYLQNIPIGVKVKTDFNQFLKHTGHKVNRIKKLA
jgi:hypothetical protein